MALHEHKAALPGGSAHNSEHKDEEGTHKIGKVMGEFKRGTLQSGSGATVTSRQQAIRIGLEEDRDVHGGGSSHNTHGVSDLVPPLPELNDLAGHDHDVGRLMGRLHGGRQ